MSSTLTVFPRCAVARNRGLRQLTLLLCAIWLHTQPASSQTVTVNGGSAPPPTTMQAAVTANGNGTVITTSGYPQLLLDVTCTTCSGGTTVNFEETADASVWTAVQAYQEGTQSTLATSTTATSMWRVQLGSSVRQVRARVSAYSAGTVTVKGYLGVLPATPLAGNVNVVGTVPVSGTFWQATQPVSNAGTFAVQAAQSGTWTVQPGNTANTTAWKVDGSAVTQPVSASSLPLPTGASTAAKQPALGTAGSASTDVITVQGIASMTKLLVTPDSVALPANQSVNVAQINGVTPLMGAGNTGTGSPRVTIATDQATVPVSLASVPSHAVTNAGTFAVQATLQAASGVDIGKLTANQSVNLAQVNGTTTVNGGSAAGILAVGGPVATNVAITGNPTNLGAQGVSAENAAITTGRMVQLVADLVGKLIVLPYANPENNLDGTIATAMTSTTSTVFSGMAAAGAGVRIYVTACTVSNASATVGTDVVLQDGSGGTTLWTLPAGAGYGGTHAVFPNPLKTTANTALYAANVTTGASTKISCTGYKGA